MGTESVGRPAPSVRTAAVVGAAAGVGTTLTIFVATFIPPWFSWRTNALSDLGVTPETALLFNGSLILGGLLALPYAWALWRVRTGDDAPTESEGLTERMPAVLFALAVLALAGIGIFPSTEPFHFPMALAFYLLATATMVADGLNRWRTTTGRVALAESALHLLVWVAWSAGISLGPGLAIPEFTGALLFVGWVVAVSPVAPIRLRGFR